MFHNQERKKERKIHREKLFPSFTPPTVIVSQTHIPSSLFSPAVCRESGGGGLDKIYEAGCCVRRHYICNGWPRFSFSRRPNKHNSTHTHIHTYVYVRREKLSDSVGAGRERKRGGCIHVSYIKAWKGHAQIVKTAEKGEKEKETPGWTAVRQREIRRWKNARAAHYNNTHHTHYVPWCVCVCVCIRNETDLNSI